MDRYVADDLGAPLPTANAGALHTIATQSPAHAWIGHPKLNPQWSVDDGASSRADLGSAAHDVILLGVEHTRVVVVTADNWRTNAAKEARDAARAAGKIPILEKFADSIHAMNASVRETLARAEISWTSTEQTLLWQ